MTANKQYFISFKKFIIPVYVQVASKEKILAYGCGQVNVEMLVEGKWNPEYFDNVRPLWPRKIGKWTRMK